MDSFFEFLPLLIFAVYALLRNRKAQQQKAAAASGGTEAVTEAKRPSGLQEFLRQLEEAASDATGEPRVAVQEISTAPVPPSTTPRSRLEKSAPAGGIRDVEFREVAGAGFEHYGHGFGASNPLSEPVFAQVAPQGFPAVRPKKSAYDPHKLASSTPLHIGTATPSRRAAIMAERLRHPDAARDAIVLNAIFQRPGDRSQRHR